jgi:hypothetical protein
MISLILLCSSISGTEAERERERERDARMLERLGENTRVCFGMYSTSVCVQIHIGQGFTVLIYMRIYN